MGKYLAASPGKVCIKCGKSIADRRGTDYCLECRAELDKERNKKKHSLVKQLIERDTVQVCTIKTCESRRTGLQKKYIVCPSCDKVCNMHDTFCRYCGQRLREENNNGPRG